MILITLTLAGALGASVMVYRDGKQKTPWRVYTESVPNDPLKVETPSHRLRAKGEGLLRKVKEEQERRFLGERMQQRLVLAEEGEEVEISEGEKEVNRLLVVSGGSIVVTTVGLWFPAANLLFIPAVFYLFRPVVKRSYKLVFEEKRFGLPLIDFIWLGSTVATGNYFVASALFGFLYFSDKLLYQTQDNSMGSLIDVFGEQPRFVWILSDGVEVEIPFEALEVGDTVVIQAGQTISIDGTIQDGDATIDQRTLTGESQPVEKGVGDEVFASTIVLSGKIYVRVERAGSDLVTAQIGKILADTADFQSEMRALGVDLADKAVGVTLGFSALALATLGTQAGLASLNAGFGYPLRTSAPIMMLNFLRITSQEGILIKDGRSLEFLGKIDTVIFDKTGTLTEEVPSVGEIYTYGYSEDELLRYTAAAEDKQSHPIAKAILKEAERRGLSLPDIEEATYNIGSGLEVSIDGRLIQVGSRRFMESAAIVISEEVKEIEHIAHEEGHSLVYVAIDAQLGGLIELHPTIRPEAFHLIRQLRDKNIEAVVISGDHEKPTQKLSKTLGIERYMAQALPEDKANFIEQLQAEGKIVCFVGDGINDSVAMKKAQVSVSLRGASTVATDTAGIILMDGSLNKLVPLFKIGREFKNDLRRGIVMSFIPGVVIIGGIFFFNWGLFTALFLYQLNWGSSILNAMWPMYKYERAQREKEEREGKVLGEGMAG